jgi:hypothetical protein
LCASGLISSIDATTINQQQFDALTDASAVATKSIGNIEARVSEITVSVGTLLLEQVGTSQTTLPYGIGLQLLRCDASKDICLDDAPDDIVLEQASGKSP